MSWSEGSPFNWRTFFTKLHTVDVNSLNPTSLYPAAEHRQSYMLEVSGDHCIRVHESGNPDGKAVVVLHGGPGGGSSPKQYQFFDPQAYRVILIDQRGCGQSTPYASVDHNTTWDLVSDIETVREFLGIDHWMVFGGSWGSTLANAGKAAETCEFTLSRILFLIRSVPRSMRLKRSALLCE